MNFSFPVSGKPKDTFAAFMTSINAKNKLFPHFRLILRRYSERQAILSGCLLAFERTNERSAIVKQSMKHSTPPTPHLHRLTRCDMRLPDGHSPPPWEVVQYAFRPWTLLVLSNKSFARQFTLSMQPGVAGCVKNVRRCDLKDTAVYLLVTILNVPKSSIMINTAPVCNRHDSPGCNL